MTANPRPPRGARRTPPPGESPRLATLAAQIRGGDQAVLERFWHEAEAAGLPLVEVDPGDSGELVVSFLWRDVADALSEQVLLIVNGLTDYEDLSANQMQRMAGTDLWFRSTRMPRDWRASYQIAPCPSGGAQPLALAISDPLNGRTMPSRGAWLSRGLGSPDLSVVELPGAPPQPWLARRDWVDAGQVTEHTVTSTALGDERRVWVYLPPGYSPAVQAYPVLVLLDGDVWGPVLDVSATLDNLIADGRVPPLVAVMVDAIDTATRWRELTCNPDFVRFLTADLLPWARSTWGVTSKPDRTVIAGQSIGGLTAAFAALTAPEAFGNVLSQSGSFWWRPEGGEDDWLRTQFEAAPKLDLRLYLEVGLLEEIQLGPTRRLVDSLRARSYGLRFREVQGGHDCACWRGGLADGLCHIARDWGTRTSG